MNMTLKEALDLRLIDIQKPLIVDKSCSILECFNIFRQNNTASVALVVDYMQEIGVVTLKDVQDWLVLRFIPIKRNSEFSQIEDVRRQLESFM